MLFKFKFQMLIEAYDPFEFLHGPPHSHTIPNDVIAFQEHLRYSTTVFQGICMRTSMSLRF